MAKTVFGEYITFAVGFAALLYISCPKRVLCEERIKMTMRLLQRIALFSFVLALALPPMAAAQGAADTYKAKCAMCHGADGAGKPAMGTKDLGSADIQKMSDADLTGRHHQRQRQDAGLQRQADRRADQRPGYLHPHSEEVVRERSLRFPLTAALHAGRHFSADQSPRTISPSLIRAELCARIYTRKLQGWRRHER